MTNNWNTLIPTPKTTNDFGQPILQDYGVDGLFEIFADWHDEQTERAAQDLRVLLDEGDAYRAEVKRQKSCTTGAQITALLDDAMPALLTQARKPDFIEDGMAWWIGEDATIGCPDDKIRALTLVAEQGGWHARTGKYPASAGFEVFPHNDTEVLTGPLSRNGAQYAMWRMVQDAMLVND